MDKCPKCPECDAAYGARCGGLDKYECGSTFDDEGLFACSVGCFRRQLVHAHEQIAALKDGLDEVSNLLHLSTQTINEMWADKAKAGEAWENLKYWRGLITWDSRVGGGDGKELDRLKAYFAEEAGHE